MDYLRHYNTLIERAKFRSIDGYSEKHHIIPTCMGGEDTDNNLVKLTAREHYVAHQLLIKIYPKHTGLIYAAKMMTLNGSEGRTESKNRIYEWLRKRHSRAISEFMTGHSFNKGVKPSRETVEKRARSNHLAQIGKPKSEAHKAALKKALENPEIREKHAAPLRATWKLQKEDGEIFLVEDLKKFCNEMGLKISSLKNSYYRGAVRACFFKGFRVLEKVS